MPEPVKRFLFNMLMWIAAVFVVLSVWLLDLLGWLEDTSYEDERME